MLTVPSARKKGRGGELRVGHVSAVEARQHHSQQMKKAAAIAPVVKSWKINMHLPRMSAEKSLGRQSLAPRRCSGTCCSEQQG